MGWRACDRWLGSVSNPSNGDRMMQASLHGTPTAEHCATISVAIELSMMSWVAVIHSPDRDRLSRHKLAAGDVEGLLAQIAKVRARVSTALRSEEHTSELQSLMRISYAVFCLKKKKQ